SRHGIERKDRRLLPGARIDLHVVRGRPRALSDTRNRRAVSGVARDEAGVHEPPPEHPPPPATDGGDPDGEEPGFGHESEGASTAPSEPSPRKSCAGNAGARNRARTDATPMPADSVTPRPDA